MNPNNLKALIPMRLFELLVPGEHIGSPLQSRNFVSFPNSVCARPRWFGVQNLFWIRLAIFRTFNHTLVVTEIVLKNYF